MRYSEVPEEKILDFLNKKGSIMLLNIIGSEGARWYTIEEQINISSATLGKRLDKAQNIGLIDTEARKVNGSAALFYILTDLGGPIFQRMTFISLKQTLEELYELNKERDRKENELMDFVKNQLYQSQQAREKWKETGERPGGPDWGDDDENEEDESGSST